MKSAIEHLNEFSLLDFLLFLKKKFFIALVVGFVIAILAVVNTWFSASDGTSVESDEHGVVLYRSEFSIYLLHVVNNNLSIHSPLRVDSLRARLTQAVSKDPKIAVEKVDGLLFKLARGSKSVKEGETAMAEALVAIQAVFAELEAPLLKADREYKAEKDLKPNKNLPYRELKATSYGEVVHIPIVFAANKSATSAQLTLSVGILAFVGGVVLTYLLFGLVALVRLLKIYESELYGKELK